MQQESKGSILNVLSTILDIQELDMQMIQLMDLKKERIHEFENINKIKADLSSQAKHKEVEILEIKTDIRLGEGKLEDILERKKKQENQQSLIKKVEEFNALSHEMSQTDKERHNEEIRMSDLLDKLAHEEDLHNKIIENLNTTSESSKVLEHEIQERIARINTEGRLLKSQREKLVAETDPEVFSIYERLLRNKKDRIVVPVEDRCCSGCHISLTAQDENLIRKAERLVFCEHCSRILYWVEREEAESATGTKPRRRRPKAATT